MLELLAGSLTWGQEAKLRPHGDSDSDLVVITDATQTALGDGIIVAWRAFAKIISVEHAVYCQVYSFDH